MTVIQAQDAAAVVVAQGDQPAAGAGEGRQWREHVAHPVRPGLGPGVAGGAPPEQGLDQEFQDEAVVLDRLFGQHAVRQDLERQLPLENRQPARPPFRRLGEDRQRAAQAVERRGLAQQVVVGDRLLGEVGGGEASVLQQGGGQQERVFVREDGGELPGPEQGEHAQAAFQARDPVGSPADRVARAEIRQQVEGRGEARFGVAQSRGGGKRRRGLKATELPEQADVAVGREVGVVVGGGRHHGPAPGAGNPEPVGDHVLLEPPVEEGLSAREHAVGERGETCIGAGQRGDGRERFIVVDGPEGGAQSARVGHPRAQAVRRQRAGQGLDGSGHGRGPPQSPLEAATEASQAAESAHQASTAKGSGRFSS